LIPRMILPKGTIVRIGQTGGVSPEAWDLQARLREDVDNRDGEGYVMDATVLKNPNGWFYEKISHRIKDADEIVFMPVQTNNSAAKFMLDKEY
jgi:hypothetical protein